MNEEGKVIILRDRGRQGSHKIRKRENKLFDIKLLGDKKDGRKAPIRTEKVREGRLLYDKNDGGEEKMRDQLLLYGQSEGGKTLVRTEREREGYPI